MFTDAASCRDNGDNQIVKLVGKGARKNLFGKQAIFLHFYKGRWDYQARRKVGLDGVDIVDRVGVAIAVVAVDLVELDVVI